jgi:hypothetical protein
MMLDSMNNQSNLIKNLIVDNGLSECIDTKKMKKMKMNSSVLDYLKNAGHKTDLAKQFNES